MDRKIFFTILIFISGCELVLCVSKRLAAFEKVIEEVRPYLRERRLRREDAYDIERRMLSEAFKKAIGEDVLKLEVEMEQSLRAAEGHDTVQGENAALIPSSDLDKDLEAESQAMPSSSTLNKNDGNGHQNKQEQNKQQTEKEQIADLQSASQSGNEVLNIESKEAGAEVGDKVISKSFLLFKNENNENSEKQQQNKDEHNLNAKIQTESGNKHLDSSPSIEIDENPTSSQNCINNKMANSASQSNENFSSSQNFVNTKMASSSTQSDGNLHSNQNFVNNKMGNPASHSDENHSSSQNFMNTKVGSSSTQSDGNLHSSQNFMNTKMASQSTQFNGNLHSSQNFMNTKDNNWESSILNEPYKKYSSDDFKYADDSINTKSYTSSEKDENQNAVNMTWQQWLVSHPNIYMRAKQFMAVPKENEGNSTDALFDFIKNAPLSSSTGALQSHSDDSLEETDQRPLNTVGHWQRNIGNMGLTTKSESYNENSQWDSNKDPIYHERYEMSHGKSDLPDCQYGGDLDMNLKNKPNDKVLNGLKYNTNSQSDGLTNEKRDLIWNNWPTAFPDSFAAKYKNRKDYTPPKLPVSDPFAMQSLIPLNKPYDVVSDAPPSLKSREVSNLKQNSPLYRSFDKNERSNMPITNDQVEVSKNDLSHEAEYKLSRLEQDDAANEHINEFWNTYASRDSDKNVERDWHKNYKT